MPHNKTDTIQHCYTPIKKLQRQNPKFKHFYSRKTSKRYVLLRRAKKSTYAHSTLGNFIKLTNVLFVPLWSSKTGSPRNDLWYFKNTLLGDIFASFCPKEGEIICSFRGLFWAPSNIWNKIHFVWAKLFSKWFTVGIFMLDLPFHFMYATTDKKKWKRYFPLFQLCLSSLYFAKN